jgi:hypothetical protein
VSRARTGRRPRSEASALARAAPRHLSRNGGETEADGLERSLESTSRGLASLLESLRASGLEAATRPYHAMQMVLLQQRLWSRNNGRDDLDHYFAAIAANARAVHRILAEFDAAIERLTEIDRLEPSGAAAPPPSSAALAAALMEETAVSSRRLATLLDWPEEDRKRFLRELVAAGVLERRGWGRGLSYRLSEASRRIAAADLARMLRR